MMRQPVGKLAAPSNSRHRTVHRKEMRRADDRWGDLFQVFGEWIADRDWKPVFVVNEQLIPVLWNSAAQRLVEQNTWIRVLENEPLKIDDQDLQHALKEVRERAPARRGALTRVTAGSHAVDVALLRPCAAASSIYVIRFPEPLAPDINKKKLQRAFKLTKTECEIAIGIHRGASPRSLAEGRGIEMNTVRTHLKSIFSKFRVHSQRGLTGQIEEWLARTDAGG